MIQGDVRSGRTRLHCRNSLRTTISETFVILRRLLKPHDQLALRESEKR